MQSYKKAKRWDYGEVITPQKLNDMSDALQAFTEQICNATSEISDKYDSEGKPLNEKLNDRLDDLESRIQFNSIDAIRDIVRNFTQEAVSYAEDQSGWLSVEQKETARKNIGAAAFADTVSYTDQIPSDPNDTTFSTKQQIARDNIDAVGRSEFNNKVAGVVKYIDQTTDAAINDDMRGVARANIGAIDRTIAEQVAQAAVDTAMATVNSKIGNAEYVKYTANQGLNPTQQGNARANIGAIATADAVTGITSTTGKLYITKGTSNIPITVDVTADLAFDGGYCEAQTQGDDAGLIKLHLTKKDAQGNARELDMGVYTPITLEGVGGGLAFDGGYCQAQTTTNSEGEQVTKYYLYLTRGGDEKIPIDGFTPIELLGGGTGGAVGGSGFVLSDKVSPGVVMTGQDAICSIVVKPRDSLTDVSGRWYVNNVWIRSADTFKEYDDEGCLFSFNAKNYLEPNKTDNKVRLELTGSDESTRKITWTIATKEFKIQWNNLSPIEIYNTASEDCILPIQVTAPQGNYQFVANGTYGYTSYGITTNAFSKTQYQNIVTNLVIPRSYLNNRYGKHIITVKLVQSDNNEIQSQPITIVVLNEVQSSPTIVLLAESTTLTQYETAKVWYYIYDKDVETANVRLILTYNGATENNLDAELNQVQVREVNTLHEFTYPFYSAHTDGAVFRVQYTKNNQTLSDQVTFIVNQSDINLSHVSGAIYNFDPRGWSNQATNRTDFGTFNNKKITFNNFDWTNGGFKEDKETVNGTEINYGTAFVIKRGSSITLPLSLFKDSDTNGKTIDISFKVKNCLNYNAQIFNNLSNNKGLKLFANSAELYLSSATPNLIKYAEETRIDLSINVDAADEFGRLVTVWLAGVPASTQQYSAGYLYDQVTSSYATIGSDECDIYIYGIRTYNTALNFLQMNQNFIADGSDINEKLTRYERNSNLYDQNGTKILEQNLIDKKDLTVIHIKTYEMPRNKKDKKNAQITIYDNGEPSLELDDYSNTQFVVQGTSSAAYERSAFNLDIDFKKCVDSNGEPIKYQISESSIPVNYLNIKVNVASSEHANNVCAVDWYNKYQPFMTEAKAASLNNDGTYKKGSAIRDSIEGKPCAVFIENLNENTGFWAGSQYVLPGSTVFYAAGDLCNSKKNTEVFGQYAKNKVPEGITHPTKACIEVGGNDTIPQQMLMSANIYNSLITTNTFNTYALEKDEDGWYNNSASNDKHYSYEWRMAPDGTAQEITEVENSWIEAMKWVGNLAVGELVQTRVYKDSNGIEHIEENNNIQNLNDPNSSYSYVYRLDHYTFIRQNNESESAFTTKINTLKEQFNQHFQLDSLLYHFLMIEYFAALDDVSKNTFYSLDYDSADGIYKWNVKAAYDWDTILGCDNDGKLLTDYGTNYEDTYGNGNRYFNASINPLWNFIRIVYKNQLYALYGNLRNTAFNAKAIKDKWNAYQLKRPEAILAYDAYAKYMLPYKTTDVFYGEDTGLGQSTAYLPRLQGNKRYQRDQFLTYQAYYMDGKYGATTTVGSLSFRTNQAVNKNFTIVPYTKTYITIIKDSQVVYSKKLSKDMVNSNGEAISWPASDSTVYVQPAALIQKFEPLSGIKVRTFDGSSAKKLLNVVLGETNASDAGWTTESGDITLGSPILQKLDLHNLSQFYADLDLNQKQAYALQQLDIEGTAISRVKIVPYSPVKILHLNNCNYLYMQNNTQVETLTFPSSIGTSDGLRELYMVDCNEAATTQILPYLSQSLNKTLPAGENRYIKITDINWTLSDTSLLHKLYEQKGFNVNGSISESIPCKITGKVHINGNLLSTEREKFESRWGNELTITANTEILVCTVKLQHEDTQQILVTKQVYENTEVTPTLLNSWLAEVNRLEYETGTTIYTNPTYPEGFSGTPPMRIIRDLIVTFPVRYTQTKKYYTVIWYKDENETQELARTTNMQYGSDADYAVVTSWYDSTTDTNRLGELPQPWSDSNNYYVFDSWDNSSGYITQNPTKIHARWLASPKTWTKITNGFLINGKQVTFNDFNAANFYALMQMTDYQRQELLGDQKTLLTSEVNIPLGYDYNYNNIQSQVLLDETVNVLNNTQPISFDEHTFSLSNAFTLLIEFNSFNSDTIRTVFSLAAKEELSTILALRITSNNQSSYSNFRYLFNNTGVSVFENTYQSVKANKRFVITNNPQTNIISAYWWDSGESIDHTYTTKWDVTYQPALKDKELILILGGEYRSDLYGSWLYAVPNIDYSYIKYWDSLLGPTQCNNLVLSSKMTMPFQFCGYKVHSYVKDSRVQYRTMFSFAQRNFMQQYRYYSSQDLLSRSKLLAYSNYYKKIFPVAWQQLFIPINDYYMSSSFTKDDLLVYFPMYSQTKQYLYPEYRDYYITGHASDQIYARVRELYGIQWTGRRILMLNNSENHTITQSAIDRLQLTTGDVVFCSSQNHPVIIITPEQLNNLPEAYKNKFSRPVNTSVNSMSVGSNTTIYVASVDSNLESLIEGGRSSSGRMTIGLVYLPDRQYDSYSLVYIYQGGYLGSCYDSSSYSVYLNPVCCFSIGQIQEV